MKRSWWAGIILFLFGLTGLACAFGPFAAQSQPSSQSGSILFIDDFSDPSTGWDTWNDNNSMVAYQDGGLRFLINQPDFDFWSRPGKYYQDVHIEVDATKNGGPDNNDFGLICRFTDRDHFYAFLISSDGYTGIINVNDGQYIILSGENMQYNEAIQLGSAVNRLGADCTGSNLRMYVNGQKVLEAQDASHMAGEVGLMVGSYDIPGVDILFDNFVVKSP